MLNAMSQGRSGLCARFTRTHRPECSVVSPPDAFPAPNAFLSRPPISWSPGQSTSLCSWNIEHPTADDDDGYEGAGPASPVVVGFRRDEQAAAETMSEPEATRKPATMAQWATGQTEPSGWTVIVAEHGSRGRCAGSVSSRPSARWWDAEGPRSSQTRSSSSGRGSARRVGAPLRPETLRELVRHG